MSAKSREALNRQRVAKMEAKQQLREQQRRRRKRDNLIAGAAMLAVAALALTLQLTVFSTNPTAGEMAALEEAMDVPSASSSPEATASPSSPSSDAAADSATDSGANAGGDPVPSADALPAVPDPSLAAGQTFTGTIDTNVGQIEVRLDGEAAPQAVSVFVTLAQEGYFAGRTCHRLTNSESLSVLQCGSQNGDGAGTPEFQWGPVENAPEDGQYPAGTIAVARGSGPDTHGTQFFLVYEDSTLDPALGGYTVMGEVTGGMEVLEDIAANGVDPAAPDSSDGPPAEPVKIDSFNLN